MSDRTIQNSEMLNQMLGFELVRRFDDAEAPYDIKELAANRDWLSVFLNYHRSKLSLTKGAEYRFLNPGQLETEKKKLKFIQELLRYQTYLNFHENRFHPLNDLNDDYLKCERLLLKIEQVQAPEDEQAKKAQLDEAIEESPDKPAKYLGFTVGKFIADKMAEIADAKTGTLIGWMSDVNERRLYWVWGGGMLSSVIEMLPDDFYRKAQAQKGIAAPAPITGYMSWVLYYTRFAINLSLLLKHTIAGPWMSAEEQKIPAWERFKTQWNQRKFSLLNDSIWGLANMACFFWLKGPGAMGMAGNLATMGLLLMDFSLSIWRFYEESTAYNKKITALYEAYARLEEQLLKAKKTATADPAQISELEKQVREARNLIMRTELDWKYKKLGMINDMVYAGGLMAAFCVACCFFFPPAMLAPATFMMIGLLGASLCFVLNAAYAGIAGALDVSKSKALSKQDHFEARELLQLFNASTDENERKALFLEMKGLMIDSDYQERMVRFQKIKLVRAILIDALIPAVIFASLVFMPLGAGIGIMAAGFAIAALSHIILKQFEPARDELPDFDEPLALEYDEFSANPARKVEDLSPLKIKKSPVLFISGKGSSEVKKVEDSEAEHLLTPKSDLSTLN
ncbi:hypothetical protein [Legionella sp. 16cNR16C]|uniref:hypothetical protein n=1 Tax=Legionella sp. 16cNR16C TaxID=2905656 RepID=UPI001E3AAF3F|nr:hypothetical protein [Legionella sp. 16cNR16C]MCE3046248.1 hypothetical protein [Legionella sp. 16cNR16C]